MVESCRRGTGEHLAHSEVFQADFRTTLIIRTSSTRREALAARPRKELLDPLRAYYMRLHVATVVEAEALVEALEEAVRAAVPVVLERQEHFISVLWPATEADNADEWDEQSFAELVFFLRSWSGADPERQITVIEDRPVDVAEERFWRAS